MVYQSSGHCGVLIPSKLTLPWSTLSGVWGREREGEGGWERMKEGGRGRETERGGTEG